MSNYSVLVIVVGPGDTAANSKDKMPVIILVGRNSNKQIGQIHLKDMDFW